jgi:hypothetical protein
MTSCVGTGSDPVPLLFTGASSSGQDGCPTSNSSRVRVSPFPPFSHNLGRNSNQEKNMTEREQDEYLRIQLEVQVEILKQLKILNHRQS